MTIEEKAKKYDEVLEKARKLCAYPTTKPFISDLQDLFPELKESEDERIRKWLIEMVEEVRKANPTNAEHNGICSEAIAWLEKQCEKKLTDNFEPKFKVGDWVVFNNKHQSIYQVEKIDDGYYMLRHTHGGTLRVYVLHDESLRLWTIQDAKDGDVLVTNNGLAFIYNYYLEEQQWPFAYGGINLYGRFNICDGLLPFTHQKVVPATKEQRALLFQKMKEAGYEWDADKKELKKELSFLKTI